MLNATRELILPTTITGSYPRPQWFTEELRGRGFKDAMGDSRFREQYLDAVACLVREQEMAGLDIVTDGDSRFDLTVGGKSWFFYVIERLRGITGHVDRSAAGGWRGLAPGHILRERAGAAGGRNCRRRPPLDVRRMSGRPHPSEDTAMIVVLMVAFAVLGFAGPAAAQNGFSFSDASRSPAGRCSTRRCSRPRSGSARGR